MSSWHRLSMLLLLTVSLSATWMSPVEAQVSQASVERMERLAKDYGIKIVLEDPEFPVETPHGEITGKPGNRAALEAYVPLLDQEFRLYPVELIQAVGLKRIVLCEELAYDGQRRNAVPDFSHDTLLLEVERGRKHQRYLRGVIHHEFFHMIDWKDDGRLYRDEAWAGLNVPGQKYGQGGHTVQDQPSTSLLTDKYPGFLNHYSTTGVEEDKAEIYSHLIISADYVGRRARADVALLKKTDRMRELMTDFCDKIDAEFWKRAGALPR